MEPTKYPDPDRMNAKVIGYCEPCGGEIYENEAYYEHDGHMVHTDCIKDYAHDVINELSTKEVVELFEMQLH